MSDADPVQAIEDLAKRKLQNRLGVRKELKRLPDQLEHGEELVTMASGTFEDGSGLVVVTDRRLIYTEQGAFKNKVEEFPFDRVATIATEKKMMSGKLKLAISGGGRYEIKNVMPKDRVDEIATFVRGKIGATTVARNDPPNAAARAGAPSPDDPGARLARLQNLRDQGLISEDEFASKRADLIEQL